MPNLFEAVKEIKETMIASLNNDIDEVEVRKIEEKHSLEEGYLTSYYNIIYLWLDEITDPKLVFPNGRRAFGHNEKKLLEQYMQDKYHADKKKGDIFSEMVEILMDRTESSIKNVYYKIDAESKEKVYPAPVSKEDEVKESSSSTDNNIDVIDSITNIFSNSEKIGIDIDGFFGSIAQLSDLAMNSYTLQQKVEELNEKIEERQQIIKSQEEKIKSLREDVSNITEEFMKIKDEVKSFVNMDGKEKLQSFRQFTEKLSYIVDKFGGIVEIKGSKVS